MKRPLEEARPVGPFVGSSEDRVSEFDSVKVERNELSDDTNYTVKGINRLGPDDIGLVVDTNAITVNGETSFGMSGDGSVATFTASSGSKVTITNRGSELVNINTN